MSGAGRPEPVLAVRGLTTELRLRAGRVPVVRDVSFGIAAGETVALVGESGCGKSMTMLSVMGLLPRVAAITAGSILLDGVDLLVEPEERRREVRGARMAMVYQDPMTSLNPLMTVGAQIAEVLTAHGARAAEARVRAVETLAEVGIAQPARAARAYPHEFSGGMRQRVVIAMALALRPRVLIADEPTTALDVTVQQQIIELVRELQRQAGMAVVWVTHDLGLVARVASRVLVMYAGNLIEEGATQALFRRPQHPYTAGLIAAIPPVSGARRPPLRQIGGKPPDLDGRPVGCPFHPRCAHAVERCRIEAPPMTARAGGGAACWVPPEEWR